MELPQLDEIYEEEKKRWLADGTWSCCYTYAKLECRERQLLASLTREKELQARNGLIEHQYETYKKVATNAGFELGIAPSDKDGKWVNVRAEEAESQLLEAKAEIAALKEGKG